MTTFDPGSTGICNWHLDSVIAALAAAIADAAIADPTTIPDSLLAAYHDAVALKATVDRINKEATDRAMREVMA